MGCRRVLPATTSGSRLRPDSADSVELSYVSPLRQGQPTVASTHYRQVPPLRYLTCERKPDSGRLPALGLRNLHKRGALWE